MRVALWTLLIVSGVPALVLTIIGSRIDPGFNAVKVVIGYAVSFLFWGFAQEVLVTTEKFSRKAAKRYRVLRVFIEPLRLCAFARECFSLP